MLLNDETKVTLMNIIDILDSNHPAVCEHTYETDAGSEICLKYSSSSQLCVAVKCFLSKHVLPTKTVPAILQFSMADIVLTQHGFDFVNTDYPWDRYVFAVQVDGETVFTAKLPNPSGRERPDVSVFSKGAWCDDLEIIKQFLYQDPTHGKDFFIGCNTWREIQTRYRNLMKLYHPDGDIGIEVEAKEIISQYGILRKKYNR